VSPVEIAKIEQELIKEGMPREEIQRLCEVHMAVFGEQLEKQKLDVPLEHPINILMEEHGIMLQVAEKLSAIANRVQQLSDESYIGDALHHLQHVAEDFQDSGKTLSKRGKRAFSQLRKARNHRGASNNVDGAQPDQRRKETALQSD